MGLAEMTAIEMERATWRHIHATLVQARDRLCEGGVRHTWIDASIAISLERATKAPAPIDMVLYCPICQLQHIDAPEDLHDIEGGCDIRGSSPWNNPPHRSHLCHGCAYVWRPADVPTNGVAAIKTKGKRDGSL